MGSLNPPQREAVLATEGPVLVVAGAGSGKTRVITHRIAYLIKERGVSPYSILAITFTNKAADEMRERVGRLVGEELAQGMWVLTFHSACARILRREHAVLGLPSTFTVYDEGDSASLMSQVLKEMGVDPRRFPPRQVAAAVERAKDQLLTPEAFLARAETPYERTVGAAFAEYQRRLASSGALDFGDLIARTVRLFAENAEVLARWQERFRYILVDEFQDTNRAQYALIKLLASRYRNICVVGDADQAIYSWRGATIQNLLDFEADYPDARVILLEQNYRSTQTILEAANAVISHNLMRKPKNLWTAGPRGDPILVYRAEDELDEAAFVAEEVAAGVARGRRYRDFAVFYRTNAQSRALEEVFLRRGIPYTVVGGVRFYERKEVKDLLAYLRLAVNPWDAVSFRRAASAPKRGVGEKTLGLFEREAQARGLDLVRMARLAGEIGVGGKARAGLEELAAAVEEIRQAAASRLPLPRVVQMAWEVSGYLAALEAEDTPEAWSRAENVKELATVAAEFERVMPGAGLEDFLERIALVSEVDEYRDEDACVLMTVHNAKGLEFPVVFMTGMEEGIFPHIRSLGDPHSLEEERRLCYVGMTRARERLYLTCAWQRSLWGGSSYNPPSRFLSELPEELVERVGPREKEAGELGTPSYRVGEEVYHEKFGRGVVVAASGAGERAEVTVEFADGSLRRLLLAYAPLRKTREG